ncbi:hypothetical protein DFQ28_009027 [Apophysomyces sp. BC1034]|nr:hypothetical protein DFQ29_007694 [Apophysomyces sp. BC1021]KAG0185647.1 hypothetical protein DFQ28_009027 [Apophysomyces sp. BC1034]
MAMENDPQISVEDFVRLQTKWHVNESSCERLRKFERSASLSLVHVLRENLDALTSRFLRPMELPYLVQSQQKFSIEPWTMQEKARHFPMLKMVPSTHDCHTEAIQDFM